MSSKKVSILAFIVLFSTIAFSMTATATSDYIDAIGGFKTSPKSVYNAGVFSDINENLWYGMNSQAVIRRTYELQIMDGKGNGIFDPGGNITLAEAIKMAAVVHNIYNGGDGSFAQGSPWYQVYVDYAISSGIISSSSFNGEYGRGAKRMEMATIFANCVSADELQEINSVVYLPDVPDSREYAEGVLIYGDDIFKLYRAGVLTGNDKLGTFKPHSAITRAEAAAIICRIVLPAERKQLNLSQVIISGDFVTEAFYSNYSSFDKFVEFGEEGYQRIFITTNIAVKDFKYVEIGFDPPVIDIHVKSILHSQDELSPDKPFVVTWLDQGAIPHRGISFIDEQNTKRSFWIGTSGLDGSLLIVEFDSSV